MEKIRISFFMIALSSISVLTAMAQDQKQAQDTTESISFETIYDEPYTINKLFVGVQPFYGEVFATNVNAGFGLEVEYFYSNKFSVKGQLRKTYSSKFFDFNRELAKKNSMSDNKPEVFNYYELGGTYHIKDFEVNSTTRVVLRKRKISNSTWASTVPLTTEVPAKVRKIYGARAGLIIWNSTADITRSLKKQGLSNADLLSAESIPLPATYLDTNGKTQDLNAFSNIYTTNIYVGGSFTWIRNMAVSFDDYEEALDDGIVNVFFDVMMAPSTRLDPVLYNGTEFYTNAIKLKNVGARIGIDGKFNRKLAWAYGGELGYRPSIEGRGFFALLKISFPVFSTNLHKKGESLNE